ncbi:MAG TPA: class I SAM-dependent methyltransferase [Acidimicrobiia bacterium]
MTDRRAGRISFDAVAEQYGAARPEYPPELFDTVVEITGITTDSRLLEMGPGTGIATRVMAERGFHITAIELGDHMAAVARRNLAEFPNVEIVVGDFETWDPGERAPFDLIYAATAFHWVDPARRYTRVAELVRPGGHLAIWTATHVFPEPGDPFFYEIQDVYDTLGDALPEGALWNKPGELPDEWGDELRASGVFDDVQYHQFAWVVDYDVEAYIALLDSFSVNLLRPPDEKAYLYGEIRRRVAARDDKLLHRGWGAPLHIARLK